MEYCSSSLTESNRPEGERKTYLAWIDKNRADMRPNKLVRQMEEDAVHERTTTEALSGHHRGSLPAS
jgi:hypothetical protein